MKKVMLNAILAIATVICVNAREADYDGQWTLSADGQYYTAANFNDANLVAALQDYFQNTYYVKYPGCTGDNVIPLEVAQPIYENEQYPNVDTDPRFVRLNLQNKGISNLHGLGILKYSLSTLDITGNNVSTIDMSGNLGITRVVANNNPVSTVDVQGCSALQIFYLENAATSPSPLTSLDLTGTAVTDLKISYSNLSSVTCASTLKLCYIRYAANLKGIDVTGCPDLNTLSLTGCDITGTVNVSQNLKLETLWCNENKKITSLDIKNNILLRDLHADNCAITGNVDVSQNSNLYTVYLNNNKITGPLEFNSPILYTVDCSSNPNLGGLSFTDCHDLYSVNANYCNYNPYVTFTGETGLKILNLLWNMKIPSVDLSTVPQLTNLNCDNCMEITELAIENCPNLVQVMCSNSKVTELDMSKNFKLTNVQTRNCKGLTSLDFSHLKMQYVEVDNCDLYTLKFGDLSDIRYLYFDRNHLTAIDLSGLPATKNLGSYFKYTDNWDYYQCGYAGKHKGKDLHYMRVGGTSSAEDPDNADHLMDNFFVDKNQFTVSRVVSWDSNVTPYVDESAGMKAPARIAASEVNSDFLIVDDINKKFTYTYDTHCPNENYRYLQFAMQPIPSNGVVTAIEDIATDVYPVSTVYYNLAGQASNTPHNGVNIEVTTMSDGATVTTKAVF